MKKVKPPYEDVQAVEIVRSGQDSWASRLGALATPFLRAWIAMVCLGYLGHHFSYLQTLVLIGLVGVVLNQGEYIHWSRSRRRQLDTMATRWKARGASE